MQLSHTHCMNIYCIHCKKDYLVSRQQAGCHCQTPGNNYYSRRGRVWLVSSRLGTGNLLTLFYSVVSKSIVHKFQTFVAVYCVELYLAVTIGFQSLIRMSLLPVASTPSSELSVER
jgi:hypothetical protein